MEELDLSKIPEQYHEPITNEVQKLFDLSNQLVALTNRAFSIDFLPTTYGKYTLECTCLATELLVIVTSPDSDNSLLFQSLCYGKK